MKCPIHDVPLVCYCPVCRGSVKSKRKATASRQNGKLGGRPKGNISSPSQKAQRNEVSGDLQTREKLLV